MTLEMTTLAAMLLGGSSRITNTGTMVGDIELGGSDDVYIGTAGRLTGRA